MELVAVEHHKAVKRVGKGIWPICHEHLWRAHKFCWSVLYWSVVFKKKNESLSLHFTRPKAQTVICRRINKQRCHSINISIEALSIFISVPLLPHSTSHLSTSYHLWVTIKWYANKLETRLKSAIFHDDSLWIQLTLRNKTFTGCLVDVFSRSFCSTMSISSKNFFKRRSV